MSLARVTDGLEEAPGGLGAGEGLGEAGQGRRAGGQGGGGAQVLGDQLRVAALQAGLQSRQRDKHPSLYGWRHLCRYQWAPPLDPKRELSHRALNGRNSRRRFHVYSAPSGLHRIVDAPGRGAMPLAIPCRPVGAEEWLRGTTAPSLRSFRPGERMAGHAMISRTTRPW